VLDGGGVGAGGGCVLDGGGVGAGGLADAGGLDSMSCGFVCCGFVWANAAAWNRARLATTAAKPRSAHTTGGRLEEGMH
jgi:hypothetical protein